MLINEFLFEKLKKIQQKKETEKKEGPESKTINTTSNLIKESLRALKKILELHLNLKAEREISLTA